MITAVQNEIDRGFLDLNRFRVYRSADGKVGDTIEITDQFTWSKK